MFLYFSPQKTFIWPGIKTCKYFQKTNIFVHFFLHFSIFLLLRLEKKQDTENNSGTKIFFFIFEYLHRVKYCLHCLIIKTEFSSPEVLKTNTSLRAFYFSQGKHSIF